MPRAYSDLSLDKQNYDYFARNEYCYPYPLLYAAMTPVTSDSGCVATGTTNYYD